MKKKLADISTRFYDTQTIFSRTPSHVFQCFPAVVQSDPVKTRLYDIRKLGRTPSQLMVVKLINWKWPRPKCWKDPVPDQATYVGNDGLLISNALLYCLLLN
jgi:hypothetical protein